MKNTILLFFISFWFLFLLGCNSNDDKLPFNLVVAQAIDEFDEIKLSDSIYLGLDYETLQAYKSWGDDSIKVEIEQISLTSMCLIQRSFCEELEKSNVVPSNIYFIKVKPNNLNYIQSSLLGMLYFQKSNVQNVYDFQKGKLRKLNDVQNLNFVNPNSVYFYSTETGELIDSFTQVLNADSFYLHFNLDNLLVFQDETKDFKSSFKTLTINIPNQFSNASVIANVNGDVFGFKDDEDETEIVKKLPKNARFELYSIARVETKFYMAKEKVNMRYTSEITFEYERIEEGELMKFLGLNESNN